MLHRNTAGLLEQLPPITDAHDQGVDAAQNRVDAVEPRDVLFLFLALGNVARINDYPADNWFVKRVSEYRLERQPVAIFVRGSQLYYAQLVGVLDHCRQVRGGG